MHNARGHHALSAPGCCGIRCWCIPACRPPFTLAGCPASSQGAGMYCPLLHAPPHLGDGLDGHLLARHPVEGGQDLATGPVRGQGQAGIELVEAPSPGRSEHLFGNCQRLGRETNRGVRLERRGTVLPFCHFSGALAAHPPRASLQRERAPLPTPACGAPAGRRWSTAAGRDVLSVRGPTSAAPFAIGALVEPPADERQACGKAGAAASRCR